MAGVNPLLADAPERWFEPRPRWWEALCHAYDRVMLGVAWSDPARGLRIAGQLGRLAHRFRFHGPSPREVGELFETWPTASLSAVARAIASLHFKNRAIIALVHGAGPLHVASLIDSPEAAALRQLVARKKPALLVTWHVGAMYGISVALKRMGVPALNLRNLPFQTPEDRTRSLWRALDELRRGGIMVAVLDGPGGTSTGEVSCLGRRIVFRRGPFMLAGATGAPLIPIVPTWDSDAHIRVRLYPPLTPHAVGQGSGRASENRLASDAARWLERYLQAAPQETWLSTLRSFLNAPRAGEREDRKLASTVAMSPVEDV